MVNWGVRVLGAVFAEEPLAGFARSVTSRARPLQSSRSAALRVTASPSLSLFFSRLGVHHDLPHSGGKRGPTWHFSIASHVILN